MKAVVFKSLGGPEVLEIVDQEKQAPGPGEILVRVVSAGLNRADGLFRMGRYLREPVLPSRIGKEVGGVVEAVGFGVTDFKFGDRVGTLPAVLDENKQGAMAEYVTVPARICLPTPKSVPDIDSGAIWMQYLTAWGALNYTVQLRPAQFVVITAGSSSVSLAAVQIARYLGAVPIVTTTHADKIEALKKNGATHVIDVKNENYVERVKEVTGEDGVAVIFDSVGGGTVRDHMKVIRPEGSIIIYGSLELTKISLIPAMLIGKNINLRGYTLFPLVMDAEALAIAAKRITECLDDGRFKLIVDRRFPLTKIAEAHSYMESNVQVGKIVINP